MLIAQSVFFLFIFSKLLMAEDSKFPKILRKVIPQTRAANELYKSLLLLNINYLKMGKNIELPQYKFFTSIAEDLVKNTIKYGVGIQVEVQELKKGLLKDLRMEKKLFSILTGGLFQVFFIMALGFTFSIFAQKELSFKIDIIFTFLIFILQSFGLVTFTFLYRSLKKKHFSDLWEYLQKYYLLRSITQANAPLKTLSEKVNVHTLPEKGDLAYFKTNIQQLLLKVKNSGSMQVEDLNIAINELWQYVDLRFEKFDKALTAVKLMHLVVFGLGGYLVQVFLIFSKFSL